MNVEHRTSNIELKKEPKNALDKEQFGSLTVAMEYGSSFGSQQLLNNPHVSHRILQLHSFLIFSHSTFPASAGLDVSRLGGIRRSFFS
jgi:hypothetical protein